MILHLLSEESGFYEERLKRPKHSDPYLLNIGDQGESKTPLDSPESASMLEVPDVATSEWNSLSVNVHASLEGE